jgi:hypothetical protein
MTPLSFALSCWLVGSLAAAFLHLRWPRGVAERGRWGLAAGWQREIALWNLVLCIAILLAVLSGDRGCQRLVAITVVILSILLGVNHGWALRAGVRTTHAMGLVANSVGFALVLWALRATPR